MEMYKILESLDSIAEDNTKIEKIGNKVKVTTDGDSTEYDEETFKMMNDEEDMNEGLIDPQHGPIGDGKSTDCDELDAMELLKPENADCLPSSLKPQHESIEEPIEDSHLLAAEAIGQSADSDLDNTDIHNTSQEEILQGEEENDPFENNQDWYNDYDLAENDLLSDDFDDIEYSPFDATTQGKRLRAGTPIEFSDEIGGGVGVFNAKSHDGFYGNATRNGKQIKIHLSDICGADLVHNTIYESFDKQFNEKMEQLNEEVTITTTSNPLNPENDTMTLTATDEHIDMIDTLVRNAGLNNGTDSVSYADEYVDDNMSGYTPYEDESYIPTAEMDAIEGPEEDTEYMDSMEEEYENEPSDKYDRASASTETLNAMTGGLNKEKRNFDAGYTADNPLTPSDKPQKVSEQESFLNLYKTFKEKN